MIKGPILPENIKQLVTALMSFHTRLCRFVNKLIADQTGNSGKYLTTDGTSTSWSSIASHPHWSDFVGGGADYQILAADAGDIFTNSVVGTRTLTLPNAPADGTIYSFRVLNSSYPVRVVPSGSDYINILAARNQAGIESSDDRALVTLQYWSPDWINVTEFGTWTAYVP